MLFNKNCVKIYSISENKLVIFKSNDVFYAKSIDLIFDFLRECSIDNNVYINFCGNMPISNLKDSFEVIEMLSYTHSSFCYDMWVNDNWFNMSNQSLIEENAIYCNFYITTKNLQWEEFCKMKRKRSMGKDHNVLAIVLFEDCGFPCLKIKNELYKKLEPILQNLKNTGYSIKKYNF